LEQQFAGSSSTLSVSLPMVPPEDFCILLEACCRKGLGKSV
jgi:hypothetical protein